MLNEKTGKFYPLINFLGIHLFPTLVVFSCVLPVLAVFTSENQGSIVTFIGFAVTLGATVLQGVADFQMHRYRKTKPTPFIRDGLWQNSRHPNYLGEILVWWGVYFMMLSVCPDKWFLFFGVLLNTLMFAFVSIPMQDKRQSAKDGFDEYQAQTHALLPFAVKN